MRYRTNRELAVTPWANVTRGEYAFTLPAGSIVEHVRDFGPQSPGGAYVISTRTLIDLTGNRHDAIHRYVTVPADAVEPIA
jgi:hypothetical protein